MSEFDVADFGDISMEAFCVTLVSGSSPGVALSILADGEPVAFESRDDAVDWAMEAFETGGLGVAMCARQLGEWTLIVEDNGYQAAMDDRLARLAADGMGVTLYQSVNMDMNFLYARAGELVRSFDPLLDEPDEHALLEEAGLGFGLEDTDPVPAALLLIHRLTGVALSDADLGPDHDWQWAGTRAD